MIATWFTVHRESRPAVVGIRGFIGCNGDRAEALEAALADAAVEEVFLDCDGGCSRVALDVARILRRRGLKAAVIRRAYSAAVLIASAAQDRVVLEAEEHPIMLHAAQRAILGNGEMLAAAAKSIEKLNVEVLAAICDWTGADRDRVGSWLSSIRPRYLTATEALESGLATRMAPATPQWPLERVEEAGRPDALTAEETLLLGLIAAIGQVPTANAPRLRREVLAALTVKPISPPTTCGPEAAGTAPGALRSSASAPPSAAAGPRRTGRGVPRPSGR